MNETETETKQDGDLQSLICVYDRQWTLLNIPSLSCHLQRYGSPRWCKWFYYSLPMVKKEFKPVNKTESKRLKDGLIGLVKEYGPIGVRGLYYRAVCAGFVNKTEKEYGKVQRALKDLRISGDIEWDMITDCSRNVQSVNVWDNVKDVIDCAVEQIRLDTWLSQQYQVQIWLEKEGLAPLLNDTVSTYRVPLYTGKGFSSLSFTRQACLQSLEWQSQGQRAVVLQFGIMTRLASVFLKALKTNTSPLVIITHNLDV